MGVSGSHHLRLLAILLILNLSTPSCFSQVEGFGRKEMGFEERNTDKQLLEVIKVEKGGRLMMEYSTMDYQDPGANTNPRNGYLLSPPPPRKPN